MPVEPDMPAPQLYLVVEVDREAGSRLTAALAAAPVVAVLFVPATDQPFAPDSIRPLVAEAQKQGVAALVPDDAALAAAVAADGLHISQGVDVVARATAAHRQVTPKLMVGASAGASRHVAMELGELGLDYVAFEARPGIDACEARGTRLDLCTWWAEIFEVPCVAWQIADADEASEHAAGGVEFLAIRIAAGQPPTEAARNMRAIAEAVADVPREGSGT